MIAQLPVIVVLGRHLKGGHLELIRSLLEKFPKKIQIGFEGNTGEEILGSTSVANAILNADGQKITPHISQKIFALGCNLSAHFQIIESAIINSNFNLNRKNLVREPTLKLALKIICSFHTHEEIRNANVFRLGETNERLPVHSLRISNQEIWFTYSQMGHYIVLPQDLVQTMHETEEAK